MNNKLNQLILRLKADLGLLLGISFGIFLFVIFFQPFPVQRFDFNNTIIFVSGLGGIVFLFMVFTRAGMRWFIRDHDKTFSKSALLSSLGGFITAALSSVAFAFYLRYVGMVSITFHIMFKIVLICLAPPVVIRVNDTIKELRRQRDSFAEAKENIRQPVGQHAADYQKQSIEFVSDNASERLTLQVADVAFIRSADNYVEIFYRGGDNFHKKLIRNTLKNIERQTQPFPNFIRCHRTCIVNSRFVEKLTRNYDSHWLELRGYTESIPVSRQYLLQFK